MSVAAGGIVKIPASPQSLLFNLETHSDSVWLEFVMSVGHSPLKEEGGAGERQGVMVEQVLREGGTESISYCPRSFTHERVFCCLL